MTLTQLQTELTTLATSLNTAADKVQDLQGTVLGEATGRLAWVLRQFSLKIQESSERTETKYTKLVEKATAGV